MNIEKEKFNIIIIVSGFSILLLTHFLKNNFINSIGLTTIITIILFFCGAILDVKFTNQDNK